MKLFAHALLATLLAASIWGCGEDQPRVARGRGTPSAAKPKAAQTQAAAEIDENKLPPKLRNVDWNEESDEPRNNVGRDPFLPYVNDLIATVEHPKEDDPIEEAPVKGNLVQFDVQELQLLAIITGTAVNKAMLTDPSGVGHVIRAGEIVGRVPMRVERITRNEVLFRPLHPTNDQSAEIRKTLLTQEELEELLP